MSDGIKEAASLNRKRGRPSVLSPELYAYIKHQMVNIRSHRGRVNQSYLWDAMRKFDNAQNKNDYLWLYDKEKIMRDGFGMKHSLLVELGRIKDERFFWDMAYVICREKPNTKAGVDFIRRCRLGKATIYEEPQS